MWRKRRLGEKKKSAMYLKNEDEQSRRPELGSTASLPPSLPSSSILEREGEQVSYHIRTSDVLTHLQSDQVGLLKAHAAVYQQERPHQAWRKTKTL